MPAAELGPVFVQDCSPGKAGQLWELKKTTSGTWRVAVPGSDLQVCATGDSGDPYAPRPSSTLRYCDHYLLVHPIYGFSLTASGSSTFSLSVPNVQPLRPAGTGDRPHSVGKLLRPPQRLPHARPRCVVALSAELPHQRRFGLRGVPLRREQLHHAPQRARLLATPDAGSALVRNVIHMTDKGYILVSVNSAATLGAANGQVFRAQDPSTQAMHLNFLSNADGSYKLQLRSDPTQHVLGAASVDEPLQVGALTNSPRDRFRRSEVRRFAFRPCGGSTAMLGPASAMWGPVRGFSALTHRTAVSLLLNGSPDVGLSK